MGTPDAIRVNRVRLRLTQAELARAIGVDTRQINRYETGGTEPTLAIARRLADRLHISMDELAGGMSPLNGSWASAWDNLSPDAGIQRGTVELAQQGRHLTVQPLTIPANNTSTTPELAWSAEIFVDVDTLLGGYKIDNPAFTSRGLLNLTHHGETMDGTWIHLAVRGSRTGDLCLARNVETATQRLEQILADKP